MSKCLLSLKVLQSNIKVSLAYLLLLYVPPSHKKSYITLSLVHLIYTAGDNCMRQNAGLCKQNNPQLYTENCVMHMHAQKHLNTICNFPPSELAGDSKYLSIIYNPADLKMVE